MEAKSGSILTKIFGPTQDPPPIHQDPDQLCPGYCGFGKMDRRLQADAIFEVKMLIIKINIYAINTLHKVLQCYC